MANLLKEKKMQMKLAAAFGTLFLGLFLPGFAGELCGLASVWLWSDIILAGFLNQISQKRANRTTYAIILILSGIFFIFWGLKFTELHLSANPILGVGLGCFSEAYGIIRIKK